MAEPMAATARATGSRPGNRQGREKGCRAAMPIFRFAIAAAPRARRARLRVPALHRQDIADGLRQAARESADHAAALFRILDFRIERIGIFRQIGLLDEPRRGIFIGGHDASGLNSKPFGDARGESSGLRRLFLTERHIDPGMMSQVSAGAVRATSAMRAGLFQTGLPSLRQ